METFLQEICDGVVKGEVRTVEAKVQEALQKGIKPKEILEAGIKRVLAGGRGRVQNGG